jgi:hypothetical protein
MSIKSKLMEEIAAKAQKIKDKRVEAASNKTIETAVFEFFKNVEESRTLHNNIKYAEGLVYEARIALTERMRAFDPKVKVSIEYNIPAEEETVKEYTIRGVTIWWSQDHIKKNNSEQSLYIDVTQMLLF